MTGLNVEKKSELGFDGSVAVGRGIGHLMLNTTDMRRPKTGFGES